VTPYQVLRAHDRLIEGFESEAFATVMDAIPYLVSLWKAAMDSAELAPRVPDGNKFGHDWTIPNPVVGILATVKAG
jgi:hypothetical protein